MSDVSFFFGGWTPILRILIVGTLAYLGLILLLRTSGKRTLAQLNAFDFIVTVALGAALGRILTARSVALLEALTAFTLLILLQYVVTWVKGRSDRFTRIVTAQPTLLCYHGRILHAALDAQRISEAELRTAIREQGAGSLDQVAAVILESDGRFSVIRNPNAGDESALESVERG